MKFLLLLIFLVFIVVAMGFPVKKIESVELSGESIVPIDVSLYNTLTVKNSEGNDTAPKLIVSLVGGEKFYVLADEPMPHHTESSNDGKKISYFSYFIRKENAGSARNRLALVSIEAGENQFEFSRLIVATENPLICKMFGK